jgi:carbon storage regulator
MLMISRRVGERIVIGGDIEVTITEIHRRTVRIAINTGKGHQVLRGEVFDSIERANRLAAESVIDETALGTAPKGAAEGPTVESPKPTPLSASSQTIEVAAKVVPEAAKSPAEPAPAPDQDAEAADTPPKGGVKRQEVAR